MVARERLQMYWSGHMWICIHMFPNERTDKKAVTARITWIELWGRKYVWMKLDKIVWEI